MGADVVRLRAEDPHIFAHAGEWITCENGHPICKMGRTVRFGEIVNVDVDHVEWTQPSPKLGERAVWCALCGAEFWKPNNGYHFADGWRPPDAWKWPAGTMLDPKARRPGPLRRRLDQLRRWIRSGRD